MLTDLTNPQLAGLAAATVAMLLLTGGISMAVLVRLPADYFVNPQRRKAHPVLRVLKNMGGILLLALGLVMAVPGVPGNGLITMAMGLMLIDFPGKRKLEQRVFGHATVRTAIDRLRARFGRPPLDV